MKKKYLLFILLLSISISFTFAKDINNTLIKKKVDVVMKNKKNISLKKEIKIKKMLENFCVKNKRHNICHDTSKKIEVKKYTDMSLFFVIKLTQDSITKNLKYKPKKKNSPWIDLSTEYNHRYYADSEDISLLLTHLLIENGVNPKKINICFGYVIDKHAGRYSWLEIEKNNGFYYLDFKTIDDSKYPKLTSKDGRYIKLYSFKPQQK